MGVQQLRPALLIASITTLAIFSLYSLQEVALAKMESSNYGLNTVSSKDEEYLPKIKSQNTFPITSSSLDNEEIDLEPEKTKSKKVWVTMAVCWGENAQVHGKENFPYTEAALRSVKLWHSLTHAKVLLVVVYSGKVSKEMVAYQKSMEEVGAVVSLVESEPDLGCVLTSQLIRLLAFNNHLVGPEDIIITADVDAFIMTGDILKPLKKPVDVWVWRYELSYNTGYTFMMPFIGARAKTWASLLQNSTSASSLVATNRKLLGLPESTSGANWDLDQKILTRAILDAGYCSLPPTNSLWKELRLEPKPFPDASCWRGSGIWEDCNNRLWTRNAMIQWQGGGCKWWHFYPDEGVAELEQKFQEILGGRANQGFVDKVIHGARDISSGLSAMNINLKSMKSATNLLLGQETSKPKKDISGELETWTDHKDRR